MPRELPAELQPLFDQAERTLARITLESEADPDAYARKLKFAPVAIAAPKLTFKDLDMRQPAGGGPFTRVELPIELCFVWAPSLDFFIPIWAFSHAKIWEVADLLSGDTAERHAPIRRREMFGGAPSVTLSRGDGRTFVSYKGDRTSYSRLLDTALYDVVGHLGVGRTVGRPIPANASAELARWVVETCAANA